MIVIDSDITFDQAVTVDKVGFKAQFGMTYKLLGQVELDALMTRWMHRPEAAGEQAAQSIEPLSDMQFIEEVATGWRDVSNAQGEQVAFSVDALRRLCNLPGVRVAMISAFLSGYEEANEKNLPAQPAS